jgi:hypothetical protein
MATLSWERGQFGNGSLDFIAQAFNGDLIDEFAVTFTEAVSDKFTAITQPTDPTFTSVSQQSDPTFTNVYTLT